MISNRALMNMATIIVVSLALSIMIAGIVFGFPWAVVFGIVCAGLQIWNHRSTIKELSS